MVPQNVPKSSRQLSKMARCCVLEGVEIHSSRDIGRKNLQRAMKVGEDPAHTDSSCILRQLSLDAMGQRLYINGCQFFLLKTPLLCWERLGSETKRFQQVFSSTSQILDPHDGSWQLVTVDFSIHP
mmetsp:Transcript_81174/g.118852  ORF Transcript_81174/g.118852 Transcript_81174/m.118852 type:complete len:126 (-) Transcript_81174:332-709(-)